MLILATWGSTYYQKMGKNEPMLVGLTLTSARGWFHQHPKATTRTSGLTTRPPRGTAI